MGDLADVLDGVHGELGDFGELLLGGLGVAGVEEGEVGSVLDDEEFVFEGIVEVGSDAAAFGLLGIDELAGEGFLRGTATFEGGDAPPVGRRRRALSGSFDDGAGAADQPQRAAGAVSLGDGG